MLLSDCDHTRDSATENLAALTRTSTATDWSPSTSMGIRQLGEQNLLEQDQSGVLILPTPRTPSILECPFNLLNCHSTFSVRADWILHSVGHFCRVKPPKKNKCCFCESKFYSEDAVASWQNRMEHVFLHHCFGHRLAHARPDFELYEYLWQNKVISGPVYRDIKGNSGSRSHSIQTFQLAPGSLDQTSTPYTETHSNRHRYQDRPQLAR